MRIRYLALIVLRTKTMRLIRLSPLTNEQTHGMCQTAEEDYHLVGSLKVGATETIGSTYRLMVGLKKGAVAGAELIQSLTLLWPGDCKVLNMQLMQKCYSFIR